MNQKPVGIDVDLLIQVQEIAKAKGNTAANIASTLLRFAFDQADLEGIEYPTPLKRGRKKGSKAAKAAPVVSTVESEAQDVDDVSEELEDEDFNDEFYTTNKFDEMVNL